MPTPASGCADVEAAEDLVLNEEEAELVAERSLKPNQDCTVQSREFQR